MSKLEVEFMQMWQSGLLIEHNNASALRLLQGYEQADSPYGEQEFESPHLR